MLFPKTAYQVEHLGTLGCDVSLCELFEIFQTIIVPLSSVTSGPGLRGTTVPRTVENCSLADAAPHQTSPENLTCCKLPCHIFPPVTILLK